MKSQYYKKMTPVPSQITHKQYRTGTRDVIYYQDIGIANKRITIQQFVNFISGEHPASKINTGGNKTAYIYPTKKLKIPVDKEKLLSKQYVSQKNADKMLDNIEFNIGSDHLTKKDYMTLDIIANNNWERPIYFAISSGGRERNTMWLENYLQMEGFAYKLVPIKTPKKSGNTGLVDSEKSYNNFKKWNYGNLDKITMTYDADRNIARSYRTSMSRIAKALAIEGDTLKCKEVCDKSLEKIPLSKYEVDYSTASIIESYYIAGYKDKARKLTEDSFSQLIESIKYYVRFSKDEVVEKEKLYTDSYFRMIANVALRYDKEKETFIREKVEKFKKNLK